jgi:multiple sugar transport system substrate-binding protein
MKKSQSKRDGGSTTTSGWSGRRMTRRQFTAMLSGLAAVAAVAPKAPAQVRGTTLNVLYGTWFVPAAETIFKAQLEDWGKQAGVTVNYESIQWPQIQAKVTAALAANAGPDIIQFWGFWPQLYRDHLVDVSDVVAGLVKDQGPLYDTCDRVCKVGGRYLAVPQTSAFPGLPNYRVSWVKEAGFDPDPAKMPNTWEKLEPLGRALKKAGHPMGQALGHSTSDPYAIYKLMWDYGIYETDESGKHVVFDAKAMTDVMTWFIGFWNEAFTPTGLSWDDTGNNRAFLTGQVGWTINGSSVYYAAKKDAPEVFKDMNHQPMFSGPKAKTAFSTMVEHAIPTYGKNQQAAKELIAYLAKKENYAKWFDVQISYLNGPTDYWGPDYAGWKTADPRLRPFADFAKYVRLPGYAGPPDARAAEVMSKFIIVDMFARAVSGKEDAKSAVQWAAEQLKAIYEKS